MKPLHVVSAVLFCSYIFFLWYALAPECNRLQAYLDNYVSVSTQAIQNDMITKQGKVKP